MMTWSVNWDSSASCGSVWEFAKNYGRLFPEISTAIVRGDRARHVVQKFIQIHTSPHTTAISVSLYPMATVSLPVTFAIRDLQGRELVSTMLTGTETLVPISLLSRGLYLYQVGHSISGTFTRQ
jgi:hypothetical protein